MLAVGYLATSAGGRLPPLLGTGCCIAAYLIAGYEVLLAALRNIRRGDVFDENFLMAVASIGAMAVGENAEGVMVMLLYQLGEYLQHRAVDKSRDNIAALMDVRPDYANVMRGDETLRVSPEEVHRNELILVKPGEKVPLDGLVVSGASALDTAALTGESLPRDVAAGDSVLSGCVNLTGVLTVRVTAEYGQSTVAKILALVEESGEHKASTERFITRFSRWYTPAVCIAAVLIAVIPGFITGAWHSWFYTALTFLVISCPCALVISVPLTFFSGVGGASRKGILVKGANHLETLAALDTVAFDKTGTLTRGVFTVAEIVSAGMAEAELLDFAAHAEMHSAHPIARSLRDACKHELNAARVSEMTDTAGRGLSALVDGKRVLCGNGQLMQANGIECAPAEAIGTIVHVAVDGEYAGYILISDEVKPGAAAAIAALNEAGVTRTVMLTGDNETVAAEVASRLGLTEVRASLLPGDKVSAMESLLGDKCRVAFVGDGVNDAPVLRRADVGVAMGGLGSDAAIEAADVVLMDDDVGKLAAAIRLAKKTMRIARQNIVFALAVKALVMILGVLGIANMWLAVFADVGVAMLCIVNALRAMK
nr:cadmium-translocating P-type ATPase [Clostridia bacterium]